VNRRLLFATPFIFVTFLLGGCDSTRIRSAPPTRTPIPSTSTAEAAPSPASPSGELGLLENPLILALPPSAVDSPERINAAREIAAQFTERTGYVVVVTAPETYAELVDAFEHGNAHIAMLDPLSYALAYQKDLVRARYAIVREEKVKYGTQFLAPRRGGYVSYFDEANGLNTADASVALIQFRDRKPCWSEQTSPSGYVIPLGLLNQAQVQTRAAAFTGGQTTVVRSLYVGGICDFGATYIDARKFPSLEDEMPDLIEQVLVVWQTPEIIPYEVLVFSTNMPPPMRELFAGLVPAILQTDAGSAAFETAFEVTEVQPVNDGDFNEFHALVKESRLDLSLIIDK
jgi:phosphonate transport system substrate-binding protein